MNIDEEINGCILKPLETGYLLSKKFVDKIRANPNASVKISNKDLLDNGRIKLNIKQKVDFHIITKELWDNLQFNYGGGPEIQCLILQDGTPELAPLQFNVKYGSQTSTIVTSRSSDMQSFYIKCLNTFNLDFDGTFILCPLNSCTNLPLEGTVSEICSSDTRLQIVKKDVPKPTQYKHKESNSSKSTNTKITNYDPRNSVPKPPGMKNYGSTCYMNSSLQCLCSLPDIEVYLDQICMSPMSNIALLLKQIDSETKGNKLILPSPIKAEIGKRIPYFAGNRQQDSHEFTMFLLDAMHDENPEIMDNLFYGDSINKTTCAICKQSVEIRDPILSLSLPISYARRLVISPWKLDSEMTRVGQLPDLPMILIGRTRDKKNRVTTCVSIDFVEIYALEVPMEYDNDGEHAFALLRIGDEKGLPCARPILIPVPINIDLTENQIKDLVWARIQCMWPIKVQNNVKSTFILLRPPTKFTKQENNRHCNEPLSIQVPISPSKIRLHETTSNISLSELLNSYFTESQLNEENKWRCEKCGNSSCAYSKISLINLPTFLIIHLKRFVMKNNLERDNTPVSICTSLDMSSYFQEPTDNIIYDLYGISNHTGTLYGGHYTATAKRDSTWYLFNDSNVTIADEPSTSSSAYLLFYARRL